MGGVVSIGLDGAAWHALDPMIESGDLPNLKRLVENGARADLQSVRPPVTSPAWRCSTSGKNPGKLGVYWWLSLDRESGELYTPNARSFRTADIWNYLSEAGHQSAVINVPMTYPPDELDGVMVSGFGAPFDLDVTESITYPETFHEHIREEYDWQIGVEDVTAPDGPEKTYDLIRSRFELLFDLLETGTYDYLHLTVFYINVLQHKYGNGPETKRAWRLIDEYLGRLDDDVLTVLYSDHGHSKIENTFVINRYLAEHGYLSFGEEAGNSLGERLYTGMKSVGISPRSAAKSAQAVLPDQLYDMLAPDYPIPTGAVGERVDWANSAALAVSQGPIYLNKRWLGEEYRSVRDDLADELRELTHRGRSVLDAVFDREEIYWGDELHNAPDLFAVPADGWEIYGGITPATFETQVTSWTSGNHPRGMLLLHGPDVAATDLEERSLLDVMPTVLRYMDCEVPTDVDGDAIAEPFGSDALSTGWREPIAATPDRRSTDETVVRDQLENLGYLE